MRWPTTNPDRRPRSQNAPDGRVLSRAAEEASLRAAVLLQATLRGRAAQTHMWEELARHRDVVQEVAAPLAALADGPVQKGPAPRAATPRLYDDRKREVRVESMPGLDPKGHQTSTAQPRFD